MRYTLASALAAVVIITGACTSPPPRAPDPEPAPPARVAATATTTVVLDDVTNAPEPLAEPAPPPPPTAPHVDPENLGPSYRDRAEAALGTGDLAAAETHYLAWLAADPSDANSWYNLACVQSLKGETEAALLSFRASLNAGFDQLEHAGQDSDLDAIRDDPRFGEALAAAEAQRAERLLPGMERHVLTTTSLGTYVALLPPDYATSDRTYPVCVILHGSGSSETAHGRVSARLGREGVIYVAPRALQAHVGATLGRGEAGWTVWPPDAADDGSETYPMSVHVDWVFDCLDDAMARYRIDPERVAIWGHSQGAAGAITCAALRPARVDTICAFAGYYPEHEVTDARVAALVEKGVDVHLGHARDDRVVDPAGTEAFEKRLREAGATFEIRWFESGGHSLTPDVVGWSTEWLRAFADAAR